MISAQLTFPNAAPAQQNLSGLRAAVINAAETALDRVLQMTISLARSDYLDGPRPRMLGIKTGRLLLSLNTQSETSSSGVLAAIGSDVIYSAFHEFGFHGIEHVRAHGRVMSRFYAKPGEVPGNKYWRSGELHRVVAAPARLGPWPVRPAPRRQTTGSVTIQYVRAHDRQVDYNGRPYLGPALEEMLPVILSELQAELATLNPGGAA